MRVSSVPLSPPTALVQYSTIQFSFKNWNTSSQSHSQLRHLDNSIYYIDRGETMKVPPIYYFKPCSPDLRRRSYHHHANGPGIQQPGQLLNQKVIEIQKLFHHTPVDLLRGETHSENSTIAYFHHQQLNFQSGRDWSRGENGPVYCPVEQEMMRLRNVISAQNEL